MILDKCVLHSILAILSQIGLFLSGLGGGTYLLIKKGGLNSESKIFLAKNQHKFNLICLIISFVFLTAALVVGFLQAKKLWDVYWGWDVKQIGSIILWLYYFTAILVIGWHGFFKTKKTAYIVSLFALSG
ncbi:MAG TPA: hypothetical protein ENN38_03650, partial [Actinobacteria bacterium]|nr:hypothetical protein [Actinomycetota bacterium]